MKGAPGHDPGDSDALELYRNYFANELEELNTREPVRSRKQGLKKKNKKGHILFCSQTEHKEWSEALSWQQENPAWPLGTAWDWNSEEVSRLWPAALKNKPLGPWHICLSLQWLLLWEVFDISLALRPCLLLGIAAVSCSPGNQGCSRALCTGGIRTIPIHTGTELGLGVYPPAQLDSVNKTSFTSLCPYLWHKSLLPQREVEMSSSLHWF